MTFGEHLNRMLWLLDIIGTHGPITLKEINRRWLRRSESMGLEIDRQTFMREKLAIEEVFDIDIVLVGRNKYKVQDPQHTINSSLQHHLLSSIHESNFMSAFRKLGNLINIPSVQKGSEYLSLIGEALTEGKVLEVTYHKYDADPYDTKLEPYCLKLFNRRWYLFAKKVGEERIKSFSLDRVSNMDITEIKYIREPGFDPDAFFGNYFGVYMGGISVEDVIIRTTKVSMKFLVDLPLHRSQRLIDKKDAENQLKKRGLQFKERLGHDYYFMFHIAPTPDFENELIKLCENCEVLYPLWLREKLFDRLKTASEIMSGVN